MINFHIEASFTAGSNHSFTLSNSTITSIGQVNSVDLFSNVPANFVIDRNNLVPGKYWAVDLSTGPTSQGTTNLLVCGKKITATNSTDNFGGIYMNLQGAATNHVRVLSNLIYNIGSLAITGGMKIDLHGTTQNTIDIYNNTIDDVTTGHGINVTTPDAGSFTALKFNNNIVTNIPGNWINLPGTADNLLQSSITIRTTRSARQDTTDTPPVPTPITNPRPTSMRPTGCITLRSPLVSMQAWETSLHWD